MEPFAVRRLVGEVLGTLRPLALAKGIDLRLNIGEAVPEVMADYSRMKQILFNLLSNAIKFTQQNGTVTVQGELATVEEESTGSVVISVTDTGIGLRPEDQEKIFHEFVQIRSQYSRSQQGTGLGLPLTRRLIELHGGRLWVVSAGEGKGSTFRFNLPLSAAPMQ
jgi:signal transduction histidine kinase